MPEFMFRWTDIFDSTACNLIKIYQSEEIRIIFDMYCDLDNE